MRSVVYRCEPKNLRGLLSQGSGKKTCKKSASRSNENIYRATETERRNLTLEWK